MAALTPNWLTHFSSSPLKPPNRIEKQDFRVGLYLVQTFSTSLKQLRGRPFDSEGGGGAWHFLEINILTLKMMEINDLSSSGKKINNLTLTY